MHEPSQIFDLLAFFPHDDAPVCQSTAGSISRIQAQRDLERLSKSLDAERSVEIIASIRDRYHLALLLQWGLKSNRSLILPPNLRPATLTQIAREWPEARTISDETLASVISGGDTSVKNPTATLGARDQQKRPWVIVYTSGSRGAYVAHSKSRASLLCEAQTLLATFPELAQSDVLSSVPAYHIYGLLFSVLAPWMAGRAFIRETPGFPDEIQALCESYPNTVLVSTPAHLHHLARCKKHAFSQVTRIFSSGAALPEATWMQIQSALGHRVTSVYGSTESGGIAHRSDPKTPWSMFAGISITLRGDQHWLHSPYLDEGERPMDDQVTLIDDHQFELLGRNDGVIKSAGTRISVQHVEHALLNLSEVQDVAVLSVAVEGPRQFELWALVATTSQTPQSLRAALREHFEPIAIPRRIRCVDALPREATGKLTRAALERAFAHPIAFEHPQHGLQILDAHMERKHETRQRAHFRLHTPAGWTYFDDHFPKIQVLPAVAQLHFLILDMAAQAWPQIGHPRKLGRIKFKLPIVPDDILDLTLEHDESDRILSFQLARQNELCALGKITMSGVVHESATT